MPLDRRLLDRYIDLDTPSMWDTCPGLLHSPHPGPSGCRYHSQPCGQRSKKPEMYLDTRRWAIAFAATKAAVLFAYSHCAGRVLEYERFIHRSGRSICDASQHSRVIMLNRAIASAWPALTTCHSNRQRPLRRPHHPYVVIWRQLPLPHSQDRNQETAPTQMIPMSKFATGGNRPFAPRFVQATTTSASPVTRNTKRKIAEVLMRRGNKVS